MEYIGLVRKIGSGRDRTRQVLNYLMHSLFRAPFVGETQILQLVAIHMMHQRKLRLLRLGAPDVVVW